MRNETVIVVGGYLVDDGEHVVLVHDEDASPLALSLNSSPAQEVNRTLSPFVALSGAGAVLEHLAGADGEDGPALRLLLGVVRQDDAAGRLLGGLGGGR